MQRRWRHEFKLFFETWRLSDMEISKADILLVDDDKNTCIYLMKVLSIKNWQVDIAWKSSMALDLIRKKAYDVVVLDYRMPGMDGAELCRRIRESQPNVRAVFLTGFPAIDTVFPAFEAGAERVLAKPVDPDELIRVLEEQLAESAISHRRL
jgi:DNA-binding response OmpR family regulator